MVLISDKKLRFTSSLMRSLPIPRKTRQLEIVFILFLLMITYIQGWKNGARSSLKTDTTTEKDIKINTLLKTLPVQEKETLQDPCEGRPSPTAISLTESRPPTIYFLHIPKTAGTLVYSLIKQYANRTNGFVCEYVYDGNRFEASDFMMAIRPPPEFPVDSIEAQTVEAFQKRDRPTKLKLYKNGACRVVRGHVTYKQRDQIETPVISLTVLRDPLERFVSMYEFVLSMIRSRPGVTGWDIWFSDRPLEEEFSNASSLFHLGFYNNEEKWLAKRNVGFSFHFYGVLHQLSGMIPKFEGIGTTDQFRISNAEVLAEKAKDNICSTHILGLQSDMEETLDNVFQAMGHFAFWTEKEQQVVKRSKANRNLRRKSRDLSDHLSQELRKELERRLTHEIEVYEFAKRVIQYRRSRGINFFT